MRIGVPKEIKNHEYRVGMTPAAVREVVARGHEVWIETQAGSGIGMDDTVYAAAGARIAATAVDVFDRAELIVKVKEPQAVERARLQPHHTLFTYLHLAPDPDQTRDLLKSGATCIAYETVTSANGGLPLLAPMSEVAGRMSIQAGATALEKTHGGLGLLLAGVPGVEAGKVVILGGGVVGTNAATVAVGIGAQVTVIDKSVDALRRLNAQFGGHVRRSTRRNTPSKRICTTPISSSAVSSFRRGGAETHHARDARPHAQGRCHRRCRDRSGRLLRDLSRNDAR